ncbi:DnaJ subfamily C member 24 [Polyrhizophydium stewartii]|uniref:Diphthamide biosynthesis protein 4 n=1 Tax=Polyrhizophydium stewartii TaxID=2732419 RepID=A0ABR4N9Z7_9FUNG|nr:hypothetical protein HK105_007400 [Polyrhizophydium stewartii]
MKKSAYEVLGVPQDAPLAAIRASYMALALQWHPDKQHQQRPADTDKAAARFHDINAAWETLRDPQARAEHDRQLASSSRLGPLHDSVNIEDMDFDDALDSFFTPCRCGGRFLLSITQADAGVDAVDCSQCSLWIRITSEQAA